MYVTCCIRSITTVVINVCSGSSEFSYLLIIFTMLRRCRIDNFVFKLTCTHFTSFIFEFSTSGSD